MNFGGTQTNIQPITAFQFLFFFLVKFCFFGCAGSSLLLCQFFLVVVSRGVLPKVFTFVLGSKDLLTK